MADVPIQQSEIDQHLKDQLKFLQKSARDFDRGDLSEYKRIAVAIRILIHETKNSKSLIRQAGLDQRKFVTSCPDLEEQNLLPHCGLICMAFGRDSRVRFLAKLDGPPMDFVALNDWWNQKVIWDRVSPPFSRKELILHVADKDGGAHVDPKISEAFRRLRESSLGWQTNGRPPKNPEMHSIRQIAHEVLKSLIPAYSCVLPKGKAASLVSNMSVVAGDRAHSACLKGYHDFDITLDCPCGSGATFGLCHKKGSVGPEQK